MSGVNIRVRADATQARNEIGRLEKAIVGIDSKATKVTNTFRNLALGITAAFTGGALTKSITRSADAMTNFGNRVNLVTRDVNQTKKVMDELFKVAARSRGSIDGAAETFNRFGLALKDSNKPVEQLLVVTEAVQKAAVISGSGAESAKAAIIQLGQGLASGQLRGEELNSVLEQMPRLAQTIADGMGIPFGKLREEAMAGKITAEAVFSAILSGAYEIDEEFNTLNATVSGLATVFGNEWTRAVGELDKAIGTSNGIKSAIEGATLAVKFFGENIMKFAVLLQSQFLLAKISIRQFARDIKDIFKGIFSGEITSEETAEAIVAGFNKAKERVSKLGKVSVEFTIEKMDLMKDMLPSLATAQARIRKFTDYIVGLFKWAHNKIVGNSWWTSIWDSAKKKGGQVLAVGSSLATYLSVPMGEVSNFVSNLGTHFKNLYIDISAYWSRIATSIKEDGFSTTLSNEVDKVDPYLVDLKAKFADLSTSVKENYTDLRDEINEKGLKPTIEKGAVEVFNSTLETLKQSYATFNDSLTAILKVETGEESDVKALPTLPEIELKFKENKQSINNAIDATKKFINANPLFIVVKTIGQDLSTGFNGSFNEFGDYLSEKGAAASAIFSGVLFATLNTKLRRLVLSNALGAMFFFTAIKLQDDANFKAAVGKTAEGYGQLLGDYFRNNEGEVGSNVLSGIASLATTIGDGLLKGAFDGKDFSDTATSKITSGLIISLGALAISKKLRAGAVLAGRGIIGMMFGTSFGNKRIKVLNKDLSATGKAIDKIKRTSGKVSGVTGLIGGMIGFDVGQGIADDLGLEEDSFFALGIKMGTSIMSGIAFQMITTAAIAKLVNAIKAFAVASAINEAAKTTGFKIGAAIQKGLLVGLSVGMVAALSAMIGNAAKTAIDATIDKAGRLLTGQSSDEQQDSRIEAARNNKNLISGIAGGFINLDKTSEDTLIMLAKSITSLKEDKVFDIPANLSQLISGKSNLQVAIEKLEKAIEEKGINVQITRESFGRATPPGFAYGGSVNGPGTGKSDDIPAMLSNGEFVMQQSAVQKFGPAFMSAINRGKVPQFRAGGTEGFLDRGLTLSSKQLGIKLDLAQARGDSKEVLEIIQALNKIYVLTEEQVDFMKKGGSLEESGAKDNDRGALEVAESYAQNFQEAFRQGLSEALHGGDLKDILTGLLDNFTSSIIDSFASSFTDAAFENLTPMLTDLFKGIGESGKKAGEQIDLGGIIGDFGNKIKGLFSGGSGGGFDLGGTIMKGIGLFTGGGFFASQGGTVPSTPFSQAGKDSVPAMLMPGEVVLSKNQLRNMDNNSSSSTQQFNINVQGDVSRQTRMEIVKMMPQITGGVNAQNKENNYRR